MKFARARTSTDPPSSGSEKKENQAESSSSDEELPVRVSSSVPASGAQDLEDSDDAAQVPTPLPSHLPASKQADVSNRDNVPTKGITSDVTTNSPPVTDDIGDDPDDSSDSDPPLPPSRPSSMLPAPPVPRSSVPISENPAVNPPALQDGTNLKEKDSPTGALSALPGSVPPKQPLVPEPKSDRVHANGSPTLSEDIAHDPDDSDDNIPIPLPPEQSSQANAGVPPSKQIVTDAPRSSSVPSSRRGPPVGPPPSKQSTNASSPRGPPPGPPPKKLSAEPITEPSSPSGITSAAPGVPPG